MFTEFLKKILRRLSIAVLGMKLIIDTMHTDMGMKLIMVTMNTDMGMKLIMDTMHTDMGMKLIMDTSTKVAWPASSVQATGMGNADNIFLAYLVDSWVK